MKHFKVQTNIAFLPGRSMVKGLEDAKDYANNVQDKFTITPLSRWGKGSPNPNRDSEKDPLLPDPAKSYSNIIANMSVGEYFNKLNELLKKNPPYDYDKPVLEKFGRLGIGAGLQFDTTRLSAAVKDSMALFIKNDPVESASFFAARGMTPEAAKFTCRFGTNYNERYLQLFGGIGGNLSEDAMYFWLKKDTEGIDLNGVNKYKVHFDAAQIPKTKAFWSLTLYNKDFYFPQNLPMNRHVRNSNSGMVLNPDGSLDVYLQPESPGKKLENNWLPTPKEGYFVIMRIYWPGEDQISGRWKAPLPTKIK
jgi:DNA sulfur modification protein DndE